MKHSQILIIDQVGTKAGMDIYNSALANQLLLEGKSVQLFSNFTNLAIFAKAVFSNKPLHIMGVFTYIKAWIFIYFYCIKLSSPAKVVIHYFKSNFIDYHFLNLLAKLSQVKIVLILHDAQPLIGTSKDVISQRYLNLVDVVLVHNKDLYNSIPGRHRDVRFVPHPVLNLGSIKNKYPTKLTKINLLFFGQLKSSKGILELLKLLSKSKHLGLFHLTIAGQLRDLSKRSLNDMIRECKLENSITLKIGYHTLEEQIKLFDEHDLIVLPYLEVYQSGVMIQAMSYGLPVLATKLNYFVQEIIHENTGWLYSQNSVLEFDLIIATILKHPNLLPVVASQALTAVNLNHSIKSLTLALND
ncbi:MAG: Mannosylfructose-phosphate synthase [Bacteroidota bacterium]|jgi:glycosyltransferase involved in cell wall biosynthesis